MDLDLSNGLFNKEVSGKIVDKFLNDINKIIDKNNLIDDSKKKENRLITQFRDKMNIERNIVLNNYAKETSQCGEMYYIYAQNSKSDNVFNICICDEDKSSIVLEIPKDELPIDAKIGSVLRKNDNQYVVDEEATLKILEYIQNMENKILEEQNEFLNKVRINGHVYEVSDIGEDRIFLFDTTENTQYADEIEEINIPDEILKTAKIGDKLKYEDGIYKIDN